jgi:homocysteine S-methyltransferase
MTLIYEINPPKIVGFDSESKVQSESLLLKLEQRVSEIRSFCDGIHVTDSVLGIKRVSSLITGKLLKEKFPHLDITISMRVRDRTQDSIDQMIQQAILSKIDGVLVLKGDPSSENPHDSGFIPSKIVKEFVKSGNATKISFFLSLPSNPNFHKIQKKVQSQPRGFMTQVIHSSDQAKRISDYLRPKGFRVIPCILLPSSKNEKPAEFLNLDWSSYKEKPIEFIKLVHDIAGDVLITSPNDFIYAKEILKKIRE